MYKFVGKKGQLYVLDIKLNSNCKQEEKSGTGPGSCGGYLNNKTHIKNKNQKEDKLNNKEKILDNISNISSNIINNNPTTRGSLGLYTKNANINFYITHPREVYEDWHNHIHNIDKAFDDNNSVLSDHDDAVILRGINGKGKQIIEMNSELTTPGSIFQNPAFTSATEEDRLAEYFAKDNGMIAKITIPRGIPILYLGDTYDRVSPRDRETGTSFAADLKQELGITHFKEVLLPRDLIFRVEHFDSDSNTITMTVIGQGKRGKLRDDEDDI